MVVEPRFAVMLMPCCQEGMLYWVLIPPPLPVPSFQFQTVSELYGPPALPVVRVVPPT